MLEMNKGQLSREGTTKQVATNLATGPIMLKISKSIASVTVGSSSPTYREADGEEPDEVEGW